MSSTAPDIPDPFHMKPLEIQRMVFALDTSTPLLELGLGSASQEPFSLQESRVAG